MSDKCPSASDVINNLKNIIKHMESTVKYMDKIRRDPMTENDSLAPEYPICLDGKYKYLRFLDNPKTEKVETRKMSPKR